MKHCILAVLLAILATLVLANDGLASQLAEQEYPVGAKSVMKALPFQHYNLQAQCARLAHLGGYKQLSIEHIAMAKLLRPKSVPESDLQYRFGFIDGRLYAASVAYRGRAPLKRIARAIYKRDCPGLI